MLIQITLDFAQYIFTEMDLTLLRSINRNSAPKVGQMDYANAHTKNVLRLFSCKWFT